MSEDIKTTAELTEFQKIQQEKVKEFESKLGEVSKEYAEYGIFLSPELENIGDQRTVTAVFKINAVPEDKVKDLLSQFEIKEKDTE